MRLLDDPAPRLPVGPAGPETSGTRVRIRDGSPLIEVLAIPAGSIGTLAYTHEDGTLAVDFDPEVGFASGIAAEGVEAID